MTWQENLRRLDSELATGTISRSEHRRRREDILAEASGAPPVAPAPAAVDQQTSTPPTAPGHGWQAMNPARQSTSRPGDAPPPEAGQAGPPDTAAGAGAAGTDAVRPPAGVQAGVTPTAGVPASASTAPPWEGNQTDTANPGTAAAAAPSGSAPAEENPADTAPSGGAPTGTTPTGPTPGTSTPAGGPFGSRPADTSARAREKAEARAMLTGTATTAPSPADERATEMIRYADFGVAAPSAEHPAARNPASNPAFGTAPSAMPNEPVSEGTSRRGGLNWLVIALAVLLALGMVIGGAWWFGKDDTSSTDSSSAARNANSGDGSRAAPSLEDRLPALPGRPGATDSTVAVDKGVQLGLYPQQSADVLAEHGVREVIHRSSTDGDNAYFQLVIPAPGPDSAQTIAQRMRELATSAGFETVGTGSNTDTLTGFLGERRVRGTWYASGEVVVNLWVSQPRPADIPELTALARNAVGKLRTVLPPE